MGSRRRNEDCQKLELPLPPVRQRRSTRLSRGPPNKFGVSHTIPQLSSPLNISKYDNLLKDND